MQDLFLCMPDSTARLRHRDSIIEQNESQLLPATFHVASGLQCVPQLLPSNSRKGFGHQAPAARHNASGQQLNTMKHQASSLLP